MSLGGAATEEDANLIAKLFGSIGKIWKADEKYFDAVTGLRLEIVSNCNLHTTNKDSVIEELVSSMGVCLSAQVKVESPYNTASVRLMFVSERLSTKIERIMKRGENEFCRI
ncbi:uncharacterized protein LOC130967597 [Arachis stenosperma]|uniref:uncharacterized protein LOC130967597 n=1 Tax=Arachis stenosperma TaxID=217475 RepID=UPI0025ACA1C1|nr:uncharacterized protein LOC130967597 [Arachis stenosperma]